MSSDDKKEVFISYSTKNGEQAQYFCGLLEGEGISCWMAPRDIPPGESWAENIVKGIKECQFVAFLLSAKSLASTEIAKEIELANNFKRRILQVRIEDEPLTGALQYHLSMSQWVDAHQGEKSIRYQPALEALLKLLGKSSANMADPSSVLVQARALAKKINSEHSKGMEAANTALRARRDSGSETVYLQLPLRIGTATGIDLVFKFDEKKKTSHIYADGASDGDPLNGPFGKLIEREFSDRFSKFSWKDRGRLYKFFTLVPETPLTGDLILANDSAELCFPRFADQANILSMSVIPRLLAWGGYAAEVIRALERVNERLQVVFPESEGWRIGAPEGNRLGSCRVEGLLNVSKRKWAPQWDDYKERGLLSITLQADGNFLRGFKLGVAKYEKWFDLGEWEQRLHDEGKRAIGRKVNRSDVWPFVAELDTDWCDSGLADGKFLWQDKLDLFVEYVVNEFTKLKGLSALLDQACAAIPKLQDKEPASLPQAMQSNGWMSTLYVRNRLRLLTDKLQLRCDGSGVEVKYRYRNHETSCNEVLLTLQVGSFDIAAAFRVKEKSLEITLCNLVPPDFEIGITKNFFLKNHLTLTNEGIPSSQESCHGLDIVDWMNLIQAKVEERAEGFIIALTDLAAHLQQCVALTQWLAETLRESLPVDAGWVVESNRATSLERDQGILVYSNLWKEAKCPRADALPPIIMQIVPNAACFDELFLAVKLTVQPIPEIQRSLGRILGACDFAFGSGLQDDKSQMGIWVRKLDDPLHFTGGSHFDRPLLGEAEKPVLAERLDGIATNILRMEPMLAEAARIYNDEQFRTRFESIVKGLTDTVTKLFPANEGWKIEIKLKAGQRKSNVMVSKANWVRNGMPSTALWVGLEAWEADLHSLYFGIRKTEKAWTIPPDIAANIKAVWLQLFQIAGKVEDNWVWWRHADGSFASIWATQGGIITGQERDRLVAYYADVFVKLKQMAQSLDDLFQPQVEVIQAPVMEDAAGESPASDQ